MITKKEYDTITAGCLKDSELANALSKLRTDSLDELSVISHETKNYAAYLKTTYQFLSRKNDTLKDNKFWNNMGDTINELVEYMNRTSLYRYSFKDSEITSCKVSDIKDRIYAYIGKRYNDSIVLNTSYVNVSDDSSFLISSYMLTYGINEIIDNAYEGAVDTADIINAKADNNNDNGSVSCQSIRLELSIQADNNRIILSISNKTANMPDENMLCTADNYNNHSDNSNTAGISVDNNIGRIYHYDMNRLCTPFFTTKEKHTGLGLSIVSQMCLLSDTSLDMIYDSNTGITTVSLAFKAT